MVYQTGAAGLGVARPRHSTIDLYPRRTGTPQSLIRGYRDSPASYTIDTIDRYARSGARRPGTVAAASAVCEQPTRKHGGRPLARVHGEWPSPVPSAARPADGYGSAGNVPVPIQESCDTADTRSWARCERTTTPGTTSRNNPALRSPRQYNPATVERRANLTDGSERVSELLRSWSDGNALALDELTPIVHAELRRLAHRYLRRERAGHSLQTTALVNEAYMRLVGYNRMQWQNRDHFFAVSAQVMRRILVEHARRHNIKRGHGVRHVSLDDVAVVGEQPDLDLLALDAALDALARLDPRKVQVVEMRFFGGLSVEETATVLKVSPVTVRRDWSSAKLWLYRQLTGDTAGGR
jgi:RNA polymerase sigma-70 factor (ECF subfamily)